MPTRFAFSIWEGAPVRSPLFRLARHGRAGYVVRGVGTVVVQEVAADEYFAFGVPDLRLFSRMAAFRSVGAGAVLTAMYGDRRGKPEAVIAIFRAGRETLRWQWPDWTQDSTHLSLEAAVLAQELGSDVDVDELQDAMAGSGDPLADVQRTLDLLGRSDLGVHLTPGHPPPPGALISEAGPSDRSGRHFVRRG